MEFYSETTPSRFISGQQKYTGGIDSSWKLEINDDLQGSRTENKKKRDVSGSRLGGHNMANCCSLAVYLISLSALFNWQMQKQIGRILLSREIET